MTNTLSTTLILTIQASIPGWCNIWQVFNTGTPVTTDCKQYTSEAIQAREDRKKREEYEKKRNEIIADCEKEIQEAENRKLVMLAVLDTGIPLKNVIYYNHTNELVFNWNDYETKITKLPENITFKLK